MATEKNKQLRGQLQQESKETLMTRAAAMNVAGRSAMTKDQLIEAIVHADGDRPDEEQAQADKERLEQAERDQAGADRDRATGPTPATAPAAGDPLASTDRALADAERKKDPPAKTGDREDPRSLPVGEASPSQKAGTPPTTEAKDPGAPLTRSGTLYSVSRGRLSFMKDDGVSEGKAIALAEDVEVTMKGNPTWLDDLKRGDIVTVFGDPGDTIHATR